MNHNFAQIVCVCVYVCVGSPTWRQALATGRIRSFCSMRCLCRTQTHLPTLRQALDTCKWWSFWSMMPKPTSTKSMRCVPWEFYCRDGVGTLYSIDCFDVNQDNVQLHVFYGLQRLGCCWSTTAGSKHLPRLTIECLSAFYWIFSPAEIAPPSHQPVLRARGRWANLVLF